MAAKSTATRTDRATDWQRVDAINREHEYDARDEGFTTEEYASRYRLPRGTAEHRLKKLVVAGALVEGLRYVKTPVGFRKARVYSVAPMQVEKKTAVEKSAKRIAA